MAIPNQEFYDKTMAHLRKQKKMALRLVNGLPIGCAYRADDGCKCAIGFHIPDDKYKPEMEGLTVGGLIKTYPELQDIMPENIRLAIDLQHLHDNYADEPGMFESYAKAIALDFDLIYMPPHAVGGQ